MEDSILKKVFKPSARGKVWWAFVLIIIVVMITGVIDAGSYYNQGIEKVNNKLGLSFPKVKEIPFRLGLDLLGGSHLVYEADMTEVPSVDRKSALDGVRDVIERRVNVFGVAEPVIQTNISGGKYRIITELAGIKDVKEAIKMIGETPLLEFKEQSDGPKQLTEEEKKTLDDYNTEAKKKAEEALGKVNSGQDFVGLASEYSQDEATKDKGGDLGWITAVSNQEIFNLVSNLTVGATTKELVQSHEGYEILKLEGKRDKTNAFDNTPEKEVKASHLLICFDGIQGCESKLSKEAALAKIKSIKGYATLTSFASLVKKNSTEPGAAETGGELGWFGKSDMVEPFSDAVFAQAVNTISEPVETQYGYHLIHKQGERNISEYNVRRILVRTVSEEMIFGDQKDWKNTELTGKNLSRARVQFNPNDGTPEVSLEFDSEGAEMFATITGRNVGKPVAIFLDKYPISTPTVNEKITGGQAVISGKFNVQEAKLLAQRLNAGALPVPIKLVSQEVVGASLGKTSLEASLKAGLIGFLLVAFFMILFYRLPGLLAVFSLAIYGVLVLFVFKIWPVTLTLSGMAGFILSIGIAVDANVLIFARLKEELAAGKPLGLALEDSFSRAWPSIRDGNVSTLITCFILFQFSTSIVKGFAITLILGILVSMLSAIVITRTFLQIIPSAWLEKHNWLIGVKKANNLV